MSTQSDKSLTVLAIALTWYAHKRKDDAQVKALAMEQEKTSSPSVDKNGASSPQDDADVIDPLHYTTLHFFTAIPAALGMASLISKYVLQNDNAVRETWRRLVQENSPGALIRHGYLVQMAVYFGLGFACLAVDLTQVPAFIYRHKIQKTARIDYLIMLPKLFAVLAVNLGLPAFAQLLRRMRGRTQSSSSAGIKSTGGVRPGDLLRNYLRFDKELPSLREVSLQLAAFFMIYDIVFFYSHKWLHHRSIYAYIHKYHHEWKSPTALSAAYAHPVEHLLSNLLPAGLAVLLLRPHFVSYNVFTLAGVLLTLYEHCGYEFIDNQTFHNLHHSRFQDNYGVFFWLDEWYGTRARPKQEQNKMDAVEVVKEQTG